MEIMEITELMELIEENEQITFTITKTKEGFKYECTNDKHVLFTPLFLQWLSSEIINKKHIQNILEDYTPFGNTQPIPAHLFPGFLSVMYSAYSKSIINLNQKT